MKLEHRFYDRGEVGAIMSRVTSDVQVLQEMLTSGVLTVIGDIFGLAIIMAVMLFIDWQLALVSFAVLPILIVSMAWWSKRARMAFLETRVAIAAVNSTLNEDLNGVRVVQSLNRESENARRFDRINNWNLRATRRAGMLSAAIMPLVEILIAVATALIIVVAAVRLSGGTLDEAAGVAAIIAFAIGIQRFFDPVRDLVLQYTMFQRAMAGAERVFEVLDTEPEIEDAPDARDLPDVTGHVQFDNVSLEYVEGVRVLFDLDLEVQPGETVALVGETGAGKTSITSLITRNYEVTEGAVRIDSHDVREVTRASLVQRVGVVLQDPFLFSGTVLDNILYGNLGATREQAIEAAKVVGADQWIERLSESYDTQLAERGAESVNRPAAASRLRPSDPQRPAHPDSGRSDSQRGLADGSDDPGGDRTRDARSNGVCDCTPIVDNSLRGPNHRARVRANSGAGLARRAASNRWALREAVPDDVRSPGVRRVRRGRSPGSARPNARTRRSKRSQRNKRNRRRARAVPAGRLARLKQSGLIGIRRQSQMPPGIGHREPPPGGSRKKAQLDEIRLIDIHDRVRVFSDRGS